MVGALGTWLVILVLAIWALAISYQAEWTPPVRSMQIAPPAA
jgi:hypothetical protein